MVVCIDDRYAARATWSVPPEMELVYGPMVPLSMVLIYGYLTMTNIEDFDARQPFLFSRGCEKMFAHGDACCADSNVGFFELSPASALARFGKMCG